MAAKKHSSHDDKQVFVVQEGAYWGKIQAAVQNTVVQVFAQIGAFNWQEPYKIESEYEKRGSGFIINEQGYMITNAHVIENAKQVWIHMPALGRKTLKASIVGVCPDRDIALLHIDEEELHFVREVLGGIPYLTFGDSDLVRGADNVLVMGYPLGQYRIKSTTGVISGREFVMGNSLLQITAPINPGNSGGPLLNVLGQVIGIAIAAVPDAVNIGYAIPINELRIIIDDLASKRFVRKPILGARFVYSSDEKATFFGCPTPPGLYIATVFSGSLFEKIGVKEGDILYEFNGLRLDPYGETNVPWSLDKMSLFELVSRIKENEEINIVLYRGSERLEITFKTEIIIPFEIRKRYSDFEPIEYDVLGGLVIMNLTDNHMPFLVAASPELLRYQLPKNRISPALVISHILPGSYAHRLRSLKPGDIISEINQVEVKTVAELKRAIQKSKRSGLITLKTDQDVLVVFSLDKLLADEQRLCEAFAYPMSETIEKLNRK